VADLLIGQDVNTVVSGSQTRDRVAG
jgi:hypothetical protein